MRVSTQELKQEDISIGIELGSTRIKTVAIDSHLQVVASGNFDWENQLKDGYWTYSLNDVWVGLQQSYQMMAKELKSTYDITLKRVKSIGISAMMHGYLAFNEQEDILVPFRTWRNGNTTAAAKELSNAFNFNIPERWSIAHIYQAMLSAEPHTHQLDYVTTLAGYVHWYLTGEKVIGIGDASGMFPVDPQEKAYRQDLLEIANKLFASHGYTQQLEQLLPEIRLAGEQGGTLTDIGAKLLDPTGELEGGCTLCPPEGDAGTGMVATNAVTVNTGNISAGTSSFAMIVLEQSLQAMYPEIDIVTTPAGDEVAMIHTNNCTSDINDWMRLFNEVLQTLGIDISHEQLYGQLFEASLASDDDVGGLLSYNYISGENITDVATGYPLFLREPTNNFNLANFMKMHLYSAFSTLKIGMDLLQTQESVTVNKLIAHGGIFKTKKIAQQVLASAVNNDITVMDTASEGGAWGISILAYYSALQEQISLETFLNDYVFEGVTEVTVTPSSQEVVNFNNYVAKVKQALPIEQAIDKYLGGEADVRTIKS